MIPVNLPRGFMGVHPPPKLTMSQTKPGAQPKPKTLSVGQRWRYSTRNIFNTNNADYEGQIVKIGADGNTAFVDWGGGTPVELMAHVILTSDNWTYLGSVNDVVQVAKSGGANCGRCGEFNEYADWPYVCFQCRQDPYR